MKIKIVLIIVLLAVCGALLGFYLSQKIFFEQNFINIVEKNDISPKDLPLQAYSIDNLQKQDFAAEQMISVSELIDDDNQIEKFIFFYQSQGKKISGALNIDKQNLNENGVAELPVIIMLRGWVPVENYYIGLGTKNAAQAFAQAGFITFAPDFLGYGQSDADLSDNWEARFVKPINVIDLLNTLKAYPEILVPKELASQTKKIIIKPQFAIWAHSNGGQIAISTLEILQKNIPSTLWAPVTAPFPYSVLFYSNEYEDEGKETRQFLSIFERDYDVFDFSITQHLDSLYGPIQIHHGLKDFVAPITWSDEFVEKIEEENQKRLEDDKETIKYNYYRYEEADHNLQPNWQTAINRDIAFFREALTLND
jgi:pimeloyl-ACP methyl ester carboxylesterase